MESIPFSVVPAIWLLVVHLSLYLIDIFCKSWTGCTMRFAFLWIWWFRLCFRITLRRVLRFTLFRTSILAGIVILPSSKIPLLQLSNIDWHCWPLSHTRYVFVCEYLVCVNLSVRSPLLVRRMDPLLSKSNLPTGYMPRRNCDGIKLKIVFLPCLSWQLDITP